MEAYPDRATMLQLGDARPEDIWKAVILKRIHTDVLGLTEEIGADWRSRVRYVKEHPEDVARLLEQADKFCQEKQKYVLFLFDAMDRTANTWERMNALLKAALRISLDFRGFKRLSCKVFVRFDQCEKVKDFPDFSKLARDRETLLWSREDLNEMLWKYLQQEEAGISVFGQTRLDYFGAKKEFISSADRDVLYRKLFEQLAGDRMGKDSKRGHPYTWIVNHLADGKGQSTPRSLIAALRKAANLTNEKYPEHEYALHYECIKESVIEASNVRVDEIEEDYPWVKIFSDCLKGREVPMRESEILDIWKAKFQEGPEKALEADKALPLNLRHGWEGIVHDLCSIGVFERRDETTIDIPDLYRMAFGMKRRGGVKAKKKTPTTT